MTTPSSQQQGANPPPWHSDNSTSKQPAKVPGWAWIMLSVLLVLVLGGGGATWWWVSSSMVAAAEERQQVIRLHEKQTMGYQQSWNALQQQIEISNGLMVEVADEQLLDEGQTQVLVDQLGRSKALEQAQPIEIDESTAVEDVDVDIAKLAKAAAEVDEILEVLQEAHESVETRAQQVREEVAAREAIRLSVNGVNGRWCGLGGSAGSCATVNDLELNYDGSSLPGYRLDLSKDATGCFAGSGEPLGQYGGEPVWYCPAGASNPAIESHWQVPDWGDVSEDRLFLGMGSVSLYLRAD